MKAVIYSICFGFFLMLAAFGYNYLRPSVSTTVNDTPVSAAEVKEEAGEEKEVTEEDTKAELSFVDFDDNEIKLSDFRGKPVILNLWASWCPPCVGEMPEFEEAYKKHGENVEFIMLNVTDGQRETKDKAKNFAEEKGYTFPLYYSSALTGSPQSIPQTYVIDKEGNLVNSFMGAIDGETLEKAIDEVK